MHFQSFPMIYMLFHSLHLTVLPKKDVQVNTSKARELISFVKINMNGYCTTDVARWAFTELQAD